MARRYGTAREIRRKRRVDVIFIIIAALAILMQVILLTRYLDRKSQREDLTERYRAEEKDLSDLTKEKQSLESAVTSINSELDDLNEQAAALK